jgi:hypothetical protein
VQENAMSQSANRTREVMKLVACPPAASPGDARRSTNEPRSWPTRGAHGRDAGGVAQEGRTDRASIAILSRRRSHAMGRRIRGVRMCLLVGELQRQGFGFGSVQYPVAPTLL